jgi:hypothetical protein
LRDPGGGLERERNPALGSGSKPGATQAAEMTLTERHDELTSVDEFANFPALSRTCIRAAATPVGARSARDQSSLLVRGVDVNASRPANDSSGLVRYMNMRFMTGESPSIHVFDGRLTGRRSSWEVGRRATSATTEGPIRESALRMAVGDAAPR